MTAKYYNQSYTNATDAELHTAITASINQERTIRAPQEADRNATFRFPDLFPRFLDLPPEPRNRIYEELFMFEPSTWHSISKHCYPAILATCKELSREANEYLNDEREA
jgi:hypothetical protein